MKQVIIKIDLNKHADDSDAVELAETVIELLASYIPSQHGATDPRAGIYNVNYTVEDIL